MNDFNQYLIGKDDQNISLETIKDNRNAALALAQQATRSLHLFSYDLDPMLYDNAEFVDAAKDLAIRNRNSKIQIIIQDSKKIVQQGHRLLELARRLSSSILLRKTSAEIKPVAETFLIADATGMLHRNISDRYEGYINFNVRYDCKITLDLFNNLWERSVPDPELRRLHI